MTGNTSAVRRLCQPLLKENLEVLQKVVRFFFY